MSLFNTALPRALVQFFLPRVSFQSLRSLHKKNTEIHFETLDQLKSQWDQVHARFNKQGYVVLNPKVCDEKLTLQVSRLFGKIQNHKRSFNQDGIVEIRSESLGKEDYHVTSNIGFFPHTDGAYLQGMYVKDHRSYRIGPPKIVVLQCVKRSNKGGVNFLVDGKKILESLLKNHPDTVPIYFSNCVNMYRQNHLLVESSIFHLSHKKVSMRYSYDKDLYIPQGVAAALAFFDNDYVKNPQFSTSIDLKERQILVFDNERFLHGRTAVEGDRCFRRIWVFDDKYEMELVNPKGLAYYGLKDKHNELLDFYKKYALIEDKEDRSHTKVSTGIQLSKTQMKKLETLIQKKLFF